MSLAAIVLAAGWGRRFGRPKALLPLADGRTFLRAVLDSVRGAGPKRLVVVVGPWWGRRPAPSGATLVRNPDTDRGQITSIVAGLDACGREVDGVVVVPVDHPTVRPGTYAALAAAHEARPDAIVIPVHRERGGHPVVFPRWAFPELAGPEAGAGGARVVVRSHPDMVLRLPVDDPGVIVDLNSQTGYLYLVHGKES